MIKRGVRLLILGDYPAVRAELRNRLALEDGIQVVGEGTRAEMLSLTAARQPDLLLIDLDADPRQPTRFDSAAAIRQIKQQSPRTAVFTLSICDAPDQSLPDLSSADRFFTKGRDTGQLAGSIRNFVFDPERKLEMEQTTSIQTNVFPREQAAAVVKPAAGSRLAYIDMIRAVMMVLVIMVHAAVTYGSLGDWTYVDPVQDELTSIFLSIFVLCSQAFFMGLFFFFSGFFTPGSYDRKGVLGFWKDRLLRLAIPTALYTWVLCKVPNYIDEVANNGMQLSFGQYFTSYFFREQDEGPTWFLFALLLFSLGFSLWRLATRKANLAEKLSRIPAPGTRTLLLTGLVMGVCTFVISQWITLGESYDVFDIFSFKVQWFPTYIILFAAGAVAYRSGWMEQLPAKNLRFWAIGSLVLIVALPVLMIGGGAADGQIDTFMTGLNWRCASLSLWFGLAAVTFSMALTLWLRKLVQPGNRLAAAAGPNTFAIYLIHPLILVPICYGLSFSGLPASIKFVLASVATVLICYIVSLGLRRIPGVKAVL